MRIQNLTAATAAVAGACLLLSAGQAQEKAKDKVTDKDKADAAAVLDAGAKIREAFDHVVAVTEKGETVDRRKAAAFLTDLIDIRNGPLFDKLNELQKGRWYRAVVHCRLSLGRAKEALDAAERWAEMSPKDANVANVLFEAASIAGDQAKAVKGYAQALEAVQLIAAGEKAVNVAMLNAKEKEAYDAKQKKLREDTVKVQAKILSPVGKKSIGSFTVGLADGTGKFSWKKGGGKPLVVAFWGSKISNPTYIQGSYRELHARFGADERLQMLGVSGYPGAGDRAAEFDALMGANIPGATHLEQISLTSSLYNRLTGNLGCPILWVVAPDGKVVYSSAVGSKITLRQSSYAILSALAAVADKAGAAGAEK